MIQDPQLQQLIIDTLLTTLQSPNPEICAKSAEALGKIGPPTLIPHLQATLQDPDPIVRQTAAIAIDHLEIQQGHFHEIHQSLQEADMSDFATSEETNTAFTKLTQGQL